MQINYGKSWCIDGNQSIYSDGALKEILSILFQCSYG